MLLEILVSVSLLFCNRSHTHTRGVYVHCLSSLNLMLQCQQTGAWGMLFTYVSLLKNIPECLMFWWKCVEAPSNHFPITWTPQGATSLDMSMIKSAPTKARARRLGQWIASRRTCDWRDWRKIFLGAIWWQSRSKTMLNLTQTLKSRTRRKFCKTRLFKRQASITENPTEKKMCKHSAARQRPAQKRCDHVHMVQSVPESYWCSLVTLIRDVLNQNCFGY